MSVSKRYVYRNALRNEGKDYLAGVMPDNDARRGGRTNDDRQINPSRCKYEKNGLVYSELSRDIDIMRRKRERGTSEMT